MYGCVLEQLGNHKALTEPLAVTVELYPPDERRRDLDNCFKGLLDALQYSNIFIDDSQIVEIHAFKHHQVKGGKCTVAIASSDMDPKELLAA